MAESVRGIGVSPGIAIGIAYVLAPASTEPRQSGSPHDERQSLDRAILVSAEQLEAIASRLRTDGLVAEAGIIDAQVLMVRDPALLDAAHVRISSGESAERAVQAAAGAFKVMFEALDDPYLAARAADVQDIADRICRALYPEEVATQPDHPCILVAHDLTPSQTASIDRSLVLGIATDAGSAISHTAILSRALGIPAVVALGNLTARVQSGEEIALDGDAGLVLLEPDAREKAVLVKRAQSIARTQGRLNALRHEPATTLDGEHLIVAANIGSPDDIPRVLEAGADGIGLFRTEFLFAERSRMPREDEQETAYRSVLQAMPEQTVVIRTLDVGGDKPLPYLAQEPEDNPFLGLRGIRYTLEHSELLRIQLRALLRASSAGKLAIMFPMISEVSQLEQIQLMLEEEQQAVGGDAEIGIMVETPAAALIAEQLARHVGFFSAGTNDLAQYTLAVDRTNQRVASLYHPLHPAILRLLASTVAGAHAQGCWAGICGEMAGDPVGVPILLGLGFDELSMTPSRIPAVKQRIRSIEMAACRELALRALECASAEQVTRLIQAFMPQEVR